MNSENLYQIFRFDSPFDNYSIEDYSLSLYFYTNSKFEYLAKDGISVLVDVLHKVNEIAQQRFHGLHSHILFILAHWLK